MGLHFVQGDEHELNGLEIKMPRKVFDFNREQFTVDWNKNCMSRDFLILPPSTNIIPFIRYI
jgi:hypothetical protein